MKVQSGVPSGAVNQGADHALYVEGSGPNAIDPRALARLLHNTGIAVRYLGQSMSVRSAAQSLHPHHPNYYFLIDRDHQEDSDVEDAWSNFPNPDTDNLLIWRKRELENYFLEPSYLASSAFMSRCDRATLEGRLLRFAEERIFLDIANQTIAKIREVQKAKWIEDFSNPADFKTADKALQQLKEYEPLKSRAQTVADLLKFDAIEKSFREFELLFLDGAQKPQFGKGKWLDKVRAKPIVNSLISQCFKVVDTDGNHLTGTEAVTLVAEELLERELAAQPSDFQELHKLIKDRLNVGP